MMCGVLLGFVVFRRTRLSFMMVVLFGAIVAAYVNYMAVAYWSGHLDAMVGSVGQVGGNLTSQTTGRISSTNPERLIVLYTRLAITGVILGLAGLGLLRRLKKGIGDRVVFVMMVVPVLSLAMLSYGGELGLRVYLFTLPATSILVAYLFYPGLPSKVAPKRRFPVLAKLRPIVACALVLGLAGAFLLARFGNEKYEWTSPQERAAIDYIYERDLETTRILYLVPEGDGGSSISWSLTGVERVRQIRATAGRDPYKVDNVVEQLRDAGPGSFILATRSQEASLEIDANYPADWGPKIRVSTGPASRPGHPGLERRRGRLRAEGTADGPDRAAASRDAVPDRRDAVDALRADRAGGVRAAGDHPGDHPDPGSAGDLVLEPPPGVAVDPVPAAGGLGRAGEVHAAERLAGRTERHDDVVLRIADALGEPERRLPLPEDLLAVRRDELRQGLDRGQGLKPV